MDDQHATTKKSACFFKHMDASTLLWGILFGSIGAGFFMYGKKQQSAVPLISGIMLIVLPYFVSNIFVLVIAGIALTLIPFLIK